MNLIKVPENAEIPLIGTLQIGVIDRGSNLLQVRPTTICNLNCTFCSTNHLIHKTNYIISPDYLKKWIKTVIDLKQGGVSEINIDSVGESLTHPKIIQIVEKIKELPEAKFISMQTNGTLLTKKLIKQLETAKLNRINLSIHSLDKKKSQRLAGSNLFNIEKTLENAKLIHNSKIELIITPVWMPNVNTEDIKNIISYCKTLGCKIGIQKYEEYKYSRKQEGCKSISWYKFYEQLEKWEKEFNIKLILKPRDFEIIRTKRVPLIFKKGDKIKATVIAKGWLDNQVIAVEKNRSITVNKCNANPGDLINIQITSTNNSIYLAKLS